MRAKSPRRGGRYPEWALTVAVGAAAAPAVRGKPTRRGRRYPEWALAVAVVGCAADCTVLLGPGSRRTTRFALLAFAALRQVRRVREYEARCARRPRPCGSPSPQSSPLPGTARRAGTAEPSAAKGTTSPTKARSGRSRRDFPRRREAQGSWPRARSARFQPPYRRGCLSEESEANEASSAAGHESEHRRAVLGEAEDRLGGATRPDRTRLCCEDSHERSADRAHRGSPHPR
jgi:hypothetical protein